MEEDMLFNPIMKKKKKKKDISLELQGDDLKIESDNKPKNAFNMEEISEALPETLNNAEDAEGTDIFDLSLKKKKKKKNVVTFDDQDNLHMNGLDEDTHEASTFANEDDVTSSWSNTDRDYTYDELLLRVFEIMRDKNPDLVAGEKKRLVMKPPQVVRVGTKKTSFVNFHDICKLLHRQPKHLLAFLLSELGTSGSVDGNNQLIIKGKFQQKQIENILRRYIKEYRHVSFFYNASDVGLAARSPPSSLVSKPSLENEPQFAPTLPWLRLPQLNILFEIMALSYKMTLYHLDIYYI
ncbi:unnamed protein product [Gordionus sp. m RMFG-2023]